MSRLRSALLAGFIASSAWMFCALLFGWAADSTGRLNDGDRATIAWIGVAFLVGTFLVTLLIANSISHSAQRRHDRKEIQALSKQGTAHSNRRNERVTGDERAVEDVRRDDTRG